MGFLSFSVDFMVRDFKKYPYFSRSLFHHSFFEIHLDVTPLAPYRPAPFLPELIYVNAVRPGGGVQWWVSVREMATGTL
jgi:hypothetical protein